MNIIEGCGIYIYVCEVGENEGDCDDEKIAGGKENISARRIERSDEYRG